MGETDRIDDLVVLGRAAPEPISDGRHTVCLGGYSETVGFVRLYPTQRWMDDCKRWNVVSVPVEDASPDDTRDESYKIAGSKESWDQLHTKIDKVGQLEKSEQIQLVDRLANDCPTRLNKSHQSLGIVKPAEIVDYYLVEQEDATYQVSLDGERQQGKRDYPQKLYLEYRCEDCDLKSDRHRQHCIEWGIYRYWDKNDDPEGVFDALQLTKDNYQHYFFVGNLNHQRTSYIVISDLRFSETDMLNAGVSVEGQADLTEW
jgi:hypothetical protein